MSFPTELSNAIDGVTEVVAAHLNNLEAKVGIDNSVVPVSLDYLLKNPASINPGHKHSKLWAADGSSQAVGLDTSGNVGIGTTSPKAKLHIVDSTYQGLRLSSNETPATPKYGVLTSSQYDSATEIEGFMLVTSWGVNGQNRVSIGGSSGTQNAATQIEFWTAANATTRTGTQRVTISSSGNVGIANTSPSYLLTMEASNGGYYSTSDHSWHNGSSIRWKENPIPITKAINILKQLSGVRFTWKDSGIPGIGMIAEDVLKIVPEVVSVDKDNPEFCNGINYGSMIGILIEAIKDQQSQIEDLKAMVT